jgi:Ca2+-transporting ATPase
LPVVRLGNPLTHAQSRTHPIAATCNLIACCAAALDEGHQLWRRVQSAVSVLLGGNAGDVAFAIVKSLLTGRSVLNARQMLLVNMLTDALPAAALAVSPQVSTGQADRDEAAMWRAIVGLVCTQMLQTLADSHGPLVVATTAGSFAAMVGVVSTPGLSQLFGCKPVGHFGWGQAFFAAAAAGAVSAIAPDLLARLSDRSLVVDDDEAGTDEDGVDVAERRGQDADRATEKRVLSETTEEAAHDSAR